MTRRRQASVDATAGTAASARLSPTIDDARPRPDCDVTHEESAGAGKHPEGEELCPLKEAVGIVEPCGRDPCPFWEAGGAALGGGCVLKRAGLDLDRRPELIPFLVDIRETLEHATTPAATTGARVALAALLGFDRNNGPT
jgi:hypothetical protein